MGFFSKIFSRPQNKAMTYAQDNYEAAAFSEERSLVWSANGEQSVNPSQYTRGEILRISRYLTNNFPLIERVLSVTETFAVGPGLIANAATEDQTFNAEASKAFDEWASSSFCAQNNHYNFYEMQKLLARELILSGEVFAIMVKAASGYPQLVLVPSENVRHSGDKDDTSIDGLYLNEMGVVTAYNIFTGAGYQKFPASSVIHLVRHKQIGSLRGVGGMAASLNSARDFKDLVQLEKKAIKVHSMIALVVEKNGGEAPQGIMGGPNIRTNLAGAITPNKSNRRLESPFGGAAIVLDKGEKITALAGERSTEGYGRFIELLAREVCLNISLPYEFLVNCEKLSGSGTRFIMDGADAYFRDVQDRMLDGALQRIYGWVIASFINSKRLAPPVKALAPSPYPVSWTRPKKVSIDAQRVSNSEIALLQNSLMTFESFYSSRGLDYRHELRQHAQEEAYLDQLSKETGVPINRLRTLTAGAPTIEPSGN